MGRRSGGGANGGMGRGDSNSKGSITGVESLKNIQDKKLYNEMKSAISRYHSALGIPQKEVKLANLEGAYGVHVTENGKSKGVYLDKATFKKGTVQSVSAQKQKDYASGWSTKTNKPVAHTLTHELAHATWNSHLSSPNAKAAGKEIKSLYKKWSGDKKKTGYGKYAKTNVNEFWAETITKGIHGKSDKYTKAAKSIVKKFKLY